MAAPRRLRYLGVVSADKTLISSQTNCSSGMTQASRAAVGIVKFCYIGAVAGDDFLTTGSGVTSYSPSGLLVVSFPDESVTVTP